MLFAKLPLIALALFVFNPVAVAQNVHFPGNKLPTFTDNGLTLTATGTLAGLGNGDITIKLTAAGSSTVICYSPGGNAAPGQNKVPTTATGSTSIPSSEIKNGAVTFTVTTLVPSAPTPKEAGCPNNKWTVKLIDVEFTSATLTVEQGGKVVLQQTFPL